MKACATTKQPFDFEKIPNRKFNNIRIPRNAFGDVKTERDFTLAETLILGEVFTYAEKDAVLSRTYKKLSQELNVAPSTLSIGFNRLKDKGVISSLAQSCYIYKGKTTSFKNGIFEGTKFFFCSEILYNETFNIRGNIRHLTKSEVLIASLILTLALKHNNPAVKLGLRDVERELDVCTKTAVTSIQNLIKSGLVSRPIQDVGTNRHKKSTYHLNGEFYRHVKKWLHKKAGNVTSESKPTTPKAEYKPYTVLQQNYSSARKRWLSERRAAAEAKADKNYSRACADAEFKTAENNVRALAPKIAFAEVYNSPELTNLKQELALKEKQRARALKRLGLKPVDFIPKYYCKNCNDTGDDANGKPCDCYERFLRKGV